jgi:hypothetical protein
LGWTCHLGICCNGCAPTMGIGVVSAGISQLGGTIQLGCHCHHVCVIWHMPNCIWAFGIHGQDVGGSGAWGPLGIVEIVDASGTWK